MAQLQGFVYEGDLMQVGVGLHKHMKKYMHSFRWVCMSK
jgi:hypothetical protein